MDRRSSLPEEDIELIDDLIAWAHRLPTRAPNYFPHQTFTRVGQDVIGLDSRLQKGAARVRRLWNELRDEPAGERPWDDFWQPACLYIRAWRLPGEYDARRKQLLQFLNQIRDRLAGSRPASNPGDALVTWDNLSPVRQKILRALRGGPKQGKAIAAELGMRESQLHHHFADLTKQKLILNRSNTGYEIIQWPEGLPQGDVPEPSAQLMDGAE